MEVRNARRRNLAAMSATFTLVLAGRIGTTPLIPFFAIDTLHLSVDVAGLAIGVFGLASLVMGIPAGFLADKFGRKPVMLAGMVLQACSGLLVFVSQDASVFFLSQVVAGIGFSMNILANWVLLGDIAPPERRGAYTSIYIGSTQIGSFVGPALLGFVGQSINLRTSFLIQSGLDLAAVAIGFFALVETRSLLVRGPRISAAILKEMFSSRNQRYLSLSVWIGWMTGQAILYAAVPLYGKVYGLSVAEVGIASSLAQFTIMMGSFLVGFASDRLGRKKIYVFALLANSALILALIYATTVQSIYLLVPVFGFFNGMANASQILLIVELSPEGKRGIFTSVYRVLSDSGYAVGPVIVGILFGAGAYEFTFISFGVLVGLAALASLRLTETLKKAPLGPTSTG